MEYRIGSMNMYKFNYRSDSEISKNYQIIADLIVREQFDILAMQEVFNEGCILTLKRYLGPNWAYVWAQPKSKFVQAAEGYAFLWDTRKFRLATGEKKDKHDRPDSEKDWRALKTYAFKYFS